MANLFFSLHVMEREGSGYDNMYEVQLTNGKQVPRVEEGDDSVTAIVGRRIVALRPWLRPLIEFGVVETNDAKTRGVEYRVTPQLLRDSDFKGKTTLKRIEPHRLREQILEDLKLYGPTSIRNINLRIGEEIPHKTIQRMLKNLIKSGLVASSGATLGMKYFLN